MNARPVHLVGALPLPSTPHTPRVSAPEARPSFARNPSSSSPGRRGGSPTAHTVPPRPGPACLSPPAPPRPSQLQSPGNSGPQRAKGPQGQESGLNSSHRPAHRRYCYCNLTSNSVPSRGSCIIHRTDMRARALHNANPSLYTRFFSPQLGGMTAQRVSQSCFTGGGWLGWLTLLRVVRRPGGGARGTGCLRRLLLRIQSWSVAGDKLLGVRRCSLGGVGRTQDPLRLAAVRRPGAL